MWFIDVRYVCSYPFNDVCCAGNSNPLNDVWSIRKNVNAPMNPITMQTTKPSNQHGWTRNVQHGYYSRHGVMAALPGNRREIALYIHCN